MSGLKAGAGEGNASTRTPFAPNHPHELKVRRKCPLFWAHRKITCMMAMPGESIIHQTIYAAHEGYQEEGSRGAMEGDSQAVKPRRSSPLQVPQLMERTSPISNLVTPVL